MTYASVNKRYYNKQVASGKWTVTKQPVFYQVISAYAIIEYTTLADKVVELKVVIRDYYKDVTIKSKIQ